MLLPMQTTTYVSDFQWPMLQQQTHSSCPYFFVPHLFFFFFFKFPHPNSFFFFFFFFFPHFSELLADIVGQNQLVDAACLSRLKDTFSSLSLLPPSLALQLLQAVLVRGNPLLSLSQPPSCFVVCFVYYVVCVFLFVASAAVQRVCERCLASRPQKVALLKVCTILT